MVAGYKIRRYTFGVTVLPIPSPTSSKARRLYTRWWPRVMILLSYSNTF